VIITKVNGKHACDINKELMYFHAETCISASTNGEELMALESISGLMEIATLDNSKTARRMVKVSGERAAMNQAIHIKVPTKMI